MKGKGKSRCNSGLGVRGALCTTLLPALGISEHRCDVQAEEGDVGRKQVDSFLSDCPVQLLHHIVAHFNLAQAAHVSLSSTANPHSILSLTISELVPWVMTCKHLPYNSQQSDFSAHQGDNMTKHGNAVLCRHPNEAIIVADNKHLTNAAAPCRISQDAAIAGSCCYLDD